MHAEPAPANGTAKAGAKSELGDIRARTDALRQVFESGRTRPYEWRLQQLAGLLRMFQVEEQALLDALTKDLGKPRVEGWLMELNELVAAVKFSSKQLRKWMRPERVGTPLALQPGKSWIVREPLGVVLVMAPWNYPLLLSLNPLAGALAAGNTVVLKPSEMAPETSATLARLLPRYIDRDAVAVIEGAVAEATELLAQRFDHIFYTGNGTVGRIVMEAAAKHLTPVTLELGGKSPCIIDSELNLDVCARRLAWAKFANCGQTCVAPDYLLVHEAVHDRFVAKLVDTIQSFWGERPDQTADYGRIINARHHQRLAALFPGSGKVATGGQLDAASRYIAPTVLIDVPSDAPVMQDEIFGPILPVLKVSDLDQALRFVNARPKPLALYLFSNREQSQARVLEATSSGGVGINHAVVQLSVQGLPFGGVGASGMGAYHGKFSFETFTHRKAVLKKPTAIDPTIMYPPYTPRKESWLRRLL